MPRILAEGRTAQTPLPSKKGLRGNPFPRGGCHGGSRTLGFLIGFSPPSRHLSGARRQRRFVPSGLGEGACTSISEEVRASEGQVHEDDDSWDAAAAASVVARQTSLVVGVQRSEEHTSELQSLMRTSYAVFC